MSTPAPPPPSWPASEPTAEPARWWTGGRVVVAVVVVLVLMGLSAAGGFVAGAAWGGFAGFGEAFGEGELEEVFPGFDDAFGPDVPGTVGLDVPGAVGPPVAPGDRVEGDLALGPVEHELTISDRRDVVIEVTDADFDTVLVLLDTAGGVVESDDDGGSDRLSRIEASLPAGTYVVRVQPWSDGTDGAYELAVD